MKFSRIPLYVLFFHLFFFTNVHLYSYDSNNINLLNSGVINYAFADWWLNSEKNNDTEAIQSALSSGAEFVTISDKGSSWKVNPLFLESDQTVFFDKGVFIEAVKGAYLSRGDKLFTAEGKENIHLYGYGAVLRMRRSDYTFKPYEEGQWRHTLSFRSCRNITVKGLTLENSGGDGIYIGVARKISSDYFCKDIIIEDVKLSGHYRQGISVISVENLLIKNCIIENTGNHSPSAGIDFEPNNSDEIFINCVVDNCVIRNNFGPGILFFLANFNSKTIPVSVEIKNNRVYTNRRPISIRKIDDEIRGSIVLEDNIFIGFKGIDSSTDTFKVIWK